MTSSNNEMRVVLIGRTGNGKSATGNSLLHSRSAFDSAQSGRSITTDCKAGKYQFLDNYRQQKTLAVVDTPGFFDTDATITNEMVERKISSQIFQMTSPGVHAFLIVIRIGRFTPEEKNTVDFIQRIFGREAAKYCIVVLTAEDQLDEGQTPEEFVRSAPALADLVRACNNRMFVISNKLAGQQLEKKTNRLIEMIDNMIRVNNGNYYTNAEYQRIERQRAEEKRKREEEERRRKKAEEDALIARGKEEERKKSEEQLRKVREEEKRKADQREREAREEEKRKADQREREAREEGKRKADQREREAREEVQQKAKQREKELESQLNSARRSQSRRTYDDDDNDDGECMLRGLQSLGLGNSRSPMNHGMGMPYSLMNSDMGMPMQRMGSASSGLGGAHGGRFTGEHMATRGAANGRAIYEGARGGRYYMTPGGNKSYIRD